MYKEIMEETIVRVVHMFPEEDMAFYEKRFFVHTKFLDLYAFLLKI